VTGGGVLGHIGATNDQIAADNSGQHRPLICPANRGPHPTAAGRDDPLWLSDTEDVTGSSAAFRDRLGTSLEPFAPICVILRVTTPRRKRIVGAKRVAPRKERPMSSLRDRLHWVRGKLRLHRWGFKRDYQGNLYRECRDCGAEALDRPPAAPFG
jgi:hypothetical protein